MRKSEPPAAKGAGTLVKVCAAVTSGERVYIITDRDTRAAAELVARAAAEVSSKVDLEIVPDLKIHGAEPAAAVAEKMAAADVIFCLTRLSMAHTQARKKATDRGARFLSLPDYSLDLLASPSLTVDFGALVPLAERLGRRLDSARRAAIKTEAGTDLVLDLDGRTANRCPGLGRDAGALASPPDAEVNIAPLEGSSQGTIIVDGSIPCPELGLLTEPVRLTVIQGAVAALDGDSREIRVLERLFREAGDKARVLGEFGLGLNPKARLSGRMLEDEGCAGTVHFGFGSNATIGGKNAVSFHLDFVIKQPTVWLDEEMILERGLIL